MKRFQRIARLARRKVEALTSKAKRIKDEQAKLRVSKRDTDTDRAITSTMWCDLFVILNLVNSVGIMTGVTRDQIRLSIDSLNKKAQRAFLGLPDDARPRGIKRHI